MKRNDYLKSNNVYYLHSLMNFLSKSFFWIQKITLIISKNWLENQQKTVNLMIFQSLILNWLNNKHYQTLKDLENNPNDKIKQLKEIFPDVFQDGILNFQLLKQHLEQSENIAETNVFGLYWNGKNKASINSRIPLNSKTLKPLRDQSLNFDEAQNVIIEGDNLETLKILQKAYFNQVDVIYIDPPYNTGNDFVYDDDYSQSVQDYKEINNLVDEEGLKTTTNQKTSGRFHTNWLNMIYPRLVLARSLLKDDGVIFISIDDNEQARLKLICDEIFGEDNFQSLICWVSNKKGRQITGKLFSKTKEYILIYSKNETLIKNFYSREKLFKLMPNIYEPKEIEIYKDNISEYIIQNELHNTNSKEFNKKTRPNLFFPIYVSENDISLTKKEGFQEIYPPYNPKTNTWFVWRWSKNKIENEKYNLVWKKVNEKYKIFTKKREISFQGKDLILSSSITTKSGGDELKKLNIDAFNYPKPSLLIKFLISNLNKNALVLDFFAGSGTTGQAVMELNQEDGGNRKYILVQLDEPIPSFYSSSFKTICDITRARIERSIVKCKYNDKGFKYFKVTPTNFQLWQATTQDDDQAIEKQLNLFSQSTNEKNDYEAILYELMLKSGMRLDWNIKDRIVNEHQFWIDEQIDNLFFLKPQNLEQILEIIRQILKEKTNDSDTKVYINEAYFKGQAGDQNKLNLWEQIKQFNKQQSKQITLVVF